MKFSKKSLIIILIGLILLMIGIYQLGYHNGLEFMRKGDSGLGGLGEWIFSGSLIFIGSILCVFGYAVNK